MGGPDRLRPPRRGTDNKPHPVNPISSYEYSRNGSWRRIADSGQFTTSYTVTTGLTNGTAYVFKVRAKNQAGTGDESDQVRAVPEADAPGVPTGLTAQAGDKEVALSWTAPGSTGGAPITGYEYKLTETSGAAGGKWTATGGTGTTFTVRTQDNGDDLMNGTTYYFTVRARNGTEDEDASDESEEVSATPIGRPMAPKFSRTAEIPAYGGEVILHWNMPELDDAPSSEYKYQYQQKAGTGSYGNWTDMLNSGRDTTEYTVTGLTNGTTYTFRVRAVNIPGGAGGEGFASQEVSGTPKTTPGAPTLRATAGEEYVELSWTAPSDDGGAAISHYVYQVREGAGGYMPDDDVGQRFPNSGASTRTHTFEIEAVADDDVGNDDDENGVIIRSGRAYSFRVWAVNSETDAEDAVINKSDEVTATPRVAGVTERTFDISATIDGKSWVVAGDGTSIQVVVTVNPVFRARTSLWVGSRRRRRDGGGVPRGRHHRVREH